jgi:hypothetical protein
MAVGTTLLALGAISAGAKAIGAWNSSRAANKAGKQQEEGARLARAPLGQAYQTQMGLMEPYAALGRQSANTLGRLMQPGVPYSPGMQAQDARAFQAGPVQPPPGFAQPRLGGMMPPPGGMPPFARPMPGPRRLSGLMPRRAA